MKFCKGLIHVCYGIFCKNFRTQHTGLAFTFSNLMLDSFERFNFPMR